MNNRTLYVTPITFELLCEKWGFNPGTKYSKDNLYIRCNHKGDVNWDKAPVLFFHQFKNKKYTIILEDRP